MHVGVSILGEGCARPVPRAQHYCLAMCAAAAKKAISIISFIVRVRMQYASSSSSHTYSPPIHTMQLHSMCYSCKCEHRVRFCCHVHVLVHPFTITMQSQNGNMNKGWTTQWQTTKLNAIEMVEKHNNKASRNRRAYGGTVSCIAIVLPGWRQTCYRQCMPNGFCVSQRQRPMFRTNADVSVNAAKLLIHERTCSSDWTCSPLSFFFVFRLSISFAKILLRTTMPILYFV